MLKILDSKRKGEFKIQRIAPNGQNNGGPGESYKDVRSVNNWFVMMTNQFDVFGMKRWKISEAGELIGSLDVRDCTKNQHWAKKYGCQSGLK